MVKKMITWWNREEGNKNMKNKEETYQSIQCDILALYSASNMYLSN